MRHLDELAIEALATGREDLLNADQRAHVDGCTQCAELVSLERDAARDASVALRRAAPQMQNFDAMIARAMQAAPIEDSVAASRRSLWIGAALGGLAASALALFSLPGPRSMQGLGILGRQMLTIARAADRVVDSLVPGGWAALALVGLAFALILAIPVRFLLGERRASSNVLLSTLVVLIAAVVTVPAMRASAYRVEGQWPQPEPRVTLDLNERPTSEALRMAAEAAGLGSVARLPEDPPVTLSVREVPISSVVQALLGDANVVVIPSAHVITVRPDVEPQPALAAPAVPAPAVPAPVLSAPVASTPSAALGDRVTFGDDVEIGEDEVVRAVYTMGGNARIAGRALGDVVTMGGNADIDGEVVGNVTTMGGNIRVREGSRVHGDLNAMGGEITREEGSLVHGQALSAGEERRAGVQLFRGDYELPQEESGVLRWALWHALLFLLGLWMLGPGRKRFGVLRSELSSRPLRSMFAGLFGILAGVVLGVVFFVTVIGIPGSVVIFTLLAAGYFVGWATSAWWLGSALPLPFLKDRPVLQLAAGVGSLFLAGLVPTVGVLISIAAALAGLGAVMATRFGKSARIPKVRHVPTGPFRQAAR